MVTRREVHNTIDPTAHPKHTPGSEMVSYELRRITGLRRLLRRKESVLRRSRLKETIPVRRFEAHLNHAQNLSKTLVLCKSSFISVLATPKSTQPKYHMKTE